MKTMTAAKCLSRVKFRPVRETDWVGVYRLKGTKERKFKFLPYPHFETFVHEETLFDYKHLITNCVMTLEQLDEEGYIYDGKDVFRKAEVIIFYNDGGEQTEEFKSNEEALNRFNELIQNFGMKMVDQTTALPDG